MHLPRAGSAHLTASTRSNSRPAPLDTLRGRCRAAPALPHVALTALARGSCRSWPALPKERLRTRSSARRTWRGATEMAHRPAPAVAQALWEVVRSRTCASGCSRAGRPDRTNGPPAMAPARPAHLPAGAAVQAPHRGRRPGRWRWRARRRSGLVGLLQAASAFRRPLRATWRSGRPALAALRPISPAARRVAARLRGGLLDRESAPGPGRGLVLVRSGEPLRRGAGVGGDAQGIRRRSAACAAARHGDQAEEDPLLEGASG